MTIGIVNVSSRGQIVIPEKIRRDLGIKEGSKLVVIEKNGILFFVPPNLLPHTQSKSYFFI